VGPSYSKEFLAQARSKTQKQEAAAFWQNINYILYCMLYILCNLINNSNIIAML
jgi:hypothetical protein